METNARPPAAAAAAAVELDTAVAVVDVLLTAAAVVDEKCYSCPLKNLVAPLHEVPSTPNNYAFNFKQLQSHTGDQSV